MGKAEATFVGLRVSAVKDEQGKRFSGNYIPAHTKNGKNNSGRFDFTLVMNKNTYYDTNGVLITPKPIYYNISAWNGKNAVPGRGMADILAKALSIGKEVKYIRTEIVPYDRRVFDNRQPVVSAETNQPLITVATGYKLLERPEYGNDGATTVANEIKNWIKCHNFESRPPGWNIVGSDDVGKWNDVKAARKAAICDPAAHSYGFALITIPVGAQVTNFNQPPAQQQDLSTTPVQQENLPTPGATPPAQQENLPQPGATPTGAANDLNNQTPPVSGQEAAAGGEQSGDMPF